MKKTLALAILSLGAMSISAQSVSINGSRTIEIDPTTSTGLAKVYVVEDCASAKIVYKSKGGPVTWQRYSNLGGGYAENITDIAQDGNTYTISAETSDMGYIITEGNRQTCFWVTNYATYRNVNIGQLAVIESDCDRVTLQVDDAAECMAYYTVNGRREVIDREFKLLYYTLEYSEADGIYNQIETIENLEYFGTEFSAPAPLCDTEFRLSPDRFTQAWGGGDDVISQSFTATAVKAETSAEQTLREADNEQKVEAELGGSAPCEITFKAAVTDAAIFRRWELSSYPEFEDVDLQFSDLEFTHTFTEAGMTYVRFVANNAAGTCEYISDTYTISIGDSRLDIPNAFSPGTSEGVNDIWKVSYSSLVEFNCQIFNRWGQKIIELSNPSEGWDGYHKGKLVKPGTYFYVIKAKGADGQNYDRSGHINIIGSRSEVLGGGVTEEDNTVVE